MKTIVVFEAIDGTRFNFAEECARHDALVVAVNEAMLPLGMPQDIHAGEFFQHDREWCLQAKRNILAIVRKRFEKSNYPVLNNPDDAIHPMSVLGRILDDCGGPLNRAWGRLMWINWDNFREYEKPYYAMHPNEAQIEAAP